jgi:4a-hydroxytetrahydrobiopterin dehydratase
MFTEKDNALQATFKFKNFIEAWAFMTEVAFHAEKMNHHPNWSNVWNTVDIRLTTHDAGNTVTEKDRLLAKAIDAVFKKYEKS